MFKVSRQIAAAFFVSALTSRCMDDARGAVASMLPVSTCIMIQAFIFLLC